MVKEICRDINTPLVNLEGFFLEKGLLPFEAHLNAKAIRAAYILCIQPAAGDVNVKIGVGVKEVYNGSRIYLHIVWPKPFVSDGQQGQRNKIREVCKAFADKWFTEASIDIDAIDPNNIDGSFEEYLKKIVEEENSNFMGILSADTLELTSH